MSGDVPLIAELPLKLLIVDDEENARESLCLILEHSGYRVIAVGGGDAAINCLKKSSVQLILLDLNMPSINGHSVLRYIAEHQIDTHVIIISGKTDFVEVRNTLRFGFVHDFIKKPYDIDELLHLLANTDRMIRLKEEKKGIQRRLRQSEQMHRFFVEQSLDMIYLLNQHGEFSFLNTAIVTILGYSQAEMEGRHYAALVYQQDLEKAAYVFKIDYSGQQETKSAELRLICKGGEIKYVEITSTTIDLKSMDIFRDTLTTHGESFGIYGSIRDISERKLAEKNIQKLNWAMENSPILIVITDKEGVIEYVSQKITETTGYTAEEVLGLNPRIFGSGENAQSVYKELWQTITSGKVWYGILKNKKKTGEIYWCKQSIAPMIDSQGNITNYVAIQEDVTEALILTEKLSYQASHDSLTQLINRNEFDRRLERVVTTARKNDSEHALCYLDLDQFKVVNDTCSHTAGDELLRQISVQLIKILRARDTLARLGGDEFAIIMEHCSLYQAESVTKKIHQVIEQFQFQWEDKSFRIGVSIGLVIINSAALGPDNYLKQADMACYIAKESGRNRTHIYRENDKAIFQHHGEMNWISRINKALEEDLFCLYAQAIIPLHASEGEHCEILVRKKNKVNNKLILPGAFLPAAERFQLSPKIDRWVIGNVFDYFTTHPERLDSLSLCSINLSGLSLNDPKLFSFIEQKLKQTKIPAEKICFEITETATIANLSVATEFIARLKEYGCKFSLDDFGSGLSSFTYLKNLSVDFLKIDGYFVRDIEHDTVSLAIVKSINDIGHVMGKKTIAEFVENEHILKILREIKVDYAQGYQMGKPKLLQE